MQHTNKSGTLNRGLKERHITLMSLGSAIGVGLFLGSASAIKLAGPSILLGYMIAGLVIFSLCERLGKWQLNNLLLVLLVNMHMIILDHSLVILLVGITGSYGLLLVWLKLQQLVFTCSTGSQISRWTWALLALLLMSAFNFLSVKVFGELEFWFALIKIVTIICMIVVGAGIILFGFGNGGIATGISNLWSHGGWFPNGFSGLLLSMQMVLFAYLGVELIGVTAGEAQNPKKTLAKAIDNVFWRILLFYVGALFVMMAIYPWNELGEKGSPFVLTFQQIGIAKAAGIINFVVLTAALSSCNGGLFSTGRMLYTLAQQKKLLKDLVV